MNLLSISRLGAAEALLLFSSLALAQSSRPADCDANPRSMCVTGSLQSAASIPKSTNSGQLQVTFRNGLLRIDADNSTFRDTLNAVVAQIGAALEFPAGQLDEPIFAHIGPAPTREVIAQLLSGSHFNYVILYSPSDPATVARLVLTGADQTAESATLVPASVPVPGAPTPELYGSGFSTDPDAPSVVEAVPDQEPAGTAAWVHHDGVKLSGEDLDKMQKLQINQEQQQLRQQREQTAPPQ
jgi:hypothetical protein